MSSNFTYKESDLRNNNTSPIIVENGRSDIFPQHVNFPPQGQRMTEYPPQQIIPPAAIGSRILPGQVYVQRGQIPAPQPQVIVRNVQPVIASRVVEKRVNSIPVSSIVQPTQIQESTVTNSKRRLEPKYEYDIRYEKGEEPKV